MNFKDFGGNGKPEEGSSGHFLKIKDGESKRLVLRGDIHECYKKWVGGKGQECAPDEPGAGLRFKVNAILDENGELVAKIWEFGITIYNQLKDINAEYPLENTKIKVTRSGSTKDNTSYTVLPLVGEKDKLLPKHLDKISAISLHELVRTPQGPLRNYAPSDSDEVPF